MRNSAPPFGPTYGFGIYIHWPYCTRICPYCDFNVYAAKDRKTDDLFEALLADLAHQAADLSNHPPLSSIFFGGGTPSLMTPTQMERLVRACENAFGLQADCEITLEANPNTVTHARACDWRNAGINRLSIGLQSLDDKALTFLGRDHTSAEARKAVEIARTLFESFSVDMIYARPDQTLKDWEDELSGALALEAPHLSLYELTIAPGTAFYQAAKRGTLRPLPDTRQAQMYERTDALTQAAGLPAYEISNHARKPDDHSRHNMIYWRSGDWLGLGPGAHGRLTIDSARIATEAHAKPDDYIKAVNAKMSGLHARERLSHKATLYETLSMGLRPAAGIDRARIDALADTPLSSETLTYLREGGWLTPNSDRLALTPAGRLLADRITLELLG